MTRDRLPSDLDFQFVETGWELWASRWQTQSDDLTARGMFRTLGPHPESRFAHNDYLGLRRDPRLVSGLVQALEAGLPLTSSGSRLLSGNLDLFTSFESRFARAAGFPAALVFASASEANRAAICALVDRHDVVFHDSLAHASLIDGILHSGAKRKKFAHNNPEDLRAQLREGGGRIHLVVTESVFSMDGDVAPLLDLYQVCKEQGAMLLVDEAHAVGLFGQQRTGLAESLPKDHVLIATTQGFGKGLASAGGILCTAPSILERIHNLSRAFIFTTAPSPMAIKAAELAWDLSCADQQRRSQLDALCVHFSQGIQALGWPLPPREVPTPIFPLHCGGLASAVRTSAQLAAQQIFLRPIRPPTVPTGTERLRATVTADLHTSDVDEFLGALRHV